MRSQHLCQRNLKLLHKRVPEGAGHPLPGGRPRVGSRRQGLCRAAAGAGIEQKQMCPRCSGREALAEAWNAALGTGSWKSVFLDRLLLVSRSNTVYLEELGVQPPGARSASLRSGSTAGAAPAWGGRWRGSSPRLLPDRLIPEEPDLHSWFWGISGRAQLSPLSPAPAARPEITGRARPAQGQLSP